MALALCKSALQRGGEDVRKGREKRFSSFKSWGAGLPSAEGFLSGTRHACPRSRSPHHTVPRDSSLQPRATHLMMQPHGVLRTVFCVTHKSLSPRPQVEWRKRLKSPRAPPEVSECLGLGGGSCKGLWLKCEVGKYVRCCPHHALYESQRGGPEEMPGWPRIS